MGTQRTVKCNLCGWEWQPRKLGTPRICPHCTSPRWNQQRIRPTRKEQLAAAEERERFADHPFRVPLLGQICAGDGFEVEPLPEGIEVPVSFEAKRDGCYALLVSGDSMTAEHGQTIPDRSTVLFCRDAERHDGAIAHVEWGDGRFCVLRRIYQDPEDLTVTLRPLNRKAKTFTFAADEITVKGIFKDIIKTA